MAPLVTLLLVTAVAFFFLKQRQNRLQRAAQWGLAGMLVLTGSSHFFNTAELVLMLPQAVPGAYLLVYLTGVIELVAAIWLVRAPGLRLGIFLALFFVALMPANVYSAVAESGLGGHGPGYLWFRVPLQFLFIAWALVSTRAPRRVHSDDAAP